MCHCCEYYQPGGDMEGVQKSHCTHELKAARESMGCVESFPMKYFVFV